MSRGGRSQPYICMYRYTYICMYRCTYIGGWCKWSGSYAMEVALPPPRTRCIAFFHGDDAPPPSLPPSLTVILDPG
jgi:dienelactone hydrolase